jgi:hypothetical protein
MEAAWIGMHTAEGVTAIATCIIAAFALVAFFSLLDARRTRHAQLLQDLSRRWDEPLAVRSRELAGEYEKEALLELVDRVYHPRAWATPDDQREDADTLIRLAAALNLNETIGALWISRSLSARVIQRMWGASFEADWERWSAPIAMIRKEERDPGVYTNFERTARKMRRCLKVEERRTGTRRWRAWWLVTDWLRR